MIRVTPSAPPPHYETKVRARGRAYLRVHPTPTSHQFSRHSYWREILDDLHSRYGGICAYSASWTPRGPVDRGLDRSSVDHFIPKSKSPQAAYEWSNFRLCRARLNQRKSDSLDVVDPFGIQNGWFTIDFYTFYVRAGDTVPVWAVNPINATIARLQLNDDDDYINQRIAIIAQYACDRCTIEQVRDKYPFIAEEIVRQDFDSRFKPAMQAYFRSRQP